VASAEDVGDLGHGFRRKGIPANPRKKSSVPSKRITDSSAPF